MEPFLNIIVAMDESGNIGHQGKLPWGSLPTDFHWYLTHATTTNDPLKRVALILGRLTFEETLGHEEKYLSRWHFIVITRLSNQELLMRHPTVDPARVHVMKTFDDAVQQGRRLLELPLAMIETVLVFGGANPYEQAIASKMVRRIYLTRILTEIANCDTQVKNFDLNGFRRIRRASWEILADHDDRIVQENGWTYQFQIYENINTHGSV
jgi:dihydrofolate reductase